MLGKGNQPIRPPPKELGAGAARGAGPPNPPSFYYTIRSCVLSSVFTKKFFFIFFIYISPFIISYFGSVCQVFFKNFFKKIFHFSIDFWFRKWYNYYRKWKEKGENGIGVRRMLNPPKSPLIILYHKELGFVKSFWENFSKKYFKKLLTFG